MPSYRSQSYVYLQPFFLESATNAGPRLFTRGDALSVSWRFFCSATIAWPEAAAAAAEKEEVGCAKAPPLLVGLALRRSWWWGAALPFGLSGWRMGCADAGGMSKSRFCVKARLLWVNAHVDWTRRSEG